jgi:hypothetical protein
MWCKHKWGDVDGDYQYCTKCHIARAAPCPHRWKLLDSYSVYKVNPNQPHAFLKALQCTKCGDIKKERIS